MAFLLWLMWSYLGGKGWPRNTSDARRRCLRANRRSARTYLWAIVSGVLAVIAQAGYWIVLFPIGQDATQCAPRCLGLSPDYCCAHDSHGLLGFATHGEAGFRGYFQLGLEREFRGSVAVILSSVVFAFAHFAYGMLWPKLLVYFLVGVAFGTTAYLTNSTLPALLPHAIGDLTFFTLVWPHDAARRLVLDSGTDNWSWIHVAQAIVFTVLAVWAFQRLARESRPHIYYMPE